MNYHCAHGQTGPCNTCFEQYAKVRAEALHEAAEWVLEQYPESDWTRRDYAAGLHALARAPAAKPLVLGCAHGRPPGRPCPHCLGIGAAPASPIRRATAKDFGPSPFEAVVPMQLAAKPTPAATCARCLGTGKRPFPGFAVGPPWTSEPCPYCQRGTS